MFTTASRDNSKPQYYPGNNMPVQNKEKDEVVEQPKNMKSNDSSFTGSPGSLHEKLKQQNHHLEQQLETLKAQLKDVLEKQEVAKKNPTAAGTKNGEFLEDKKLQGMQQELNIIYRDIEQYRKETKLLQISHKDVKYIDKYRDAENKLSAMQVDLKCLELEKKTIEKTLKEKNKMLGELQFIRDQASTRNEGDPPVEEEFRDLRFRLKEAQKREQLLEKEAQRRNQHILKILAESSRVKDSLRLLSNKTGYDPIEGRIKIENAPYVQDRKKKLQELGESDVAVAERLEKNEENFDRLREDVKELKKTEAKKQKMFKMQCSRYNDQLKELDNVRMELAKNMADKDKECTIVRNKAREIYRALLENGLVPTDRDYEELLRDNQARSPIAAKRREASRSHSADGSTNGNLTVDTIKVRSMKANNSASIMPRFKKLNPPMSRINILTKRSSQPQKGAFDSMSRSPRARISSPKNQAKTTVPTTTRSPRNQVPMKSIEDQQKVAIMKSKGFRMDEIGQRGDKENQEFSDYNHVGQKKVKIGLVKVWYDAEGIAGIYAEYMTNTGETIKGVENILDKTGYKTAEFVATDGDYLGSISGFINREDSSIESLTFLSAEGVTTSVGKSKKNSKAFKFDINDFEFPSMIYGCVKARNKNQGSVLCKLGVLIASQEVEENIGAKEDISATSRALKRVI